MIHRLFSVRSRYVARDNEAAFAQTAKGAGAGAWATGASALIMFFQAYP